jgi:hypothetical protein
MFFFYPKTYFQSIFDPKHLEKSKNTFTTHINSLKQKHSKTQNKPEIKNLLEIRCGFFKTFQG